jgi:putative oxidoreductase
MRKLFSSKYSDNGIAFGALLLRLAAGGLMIPHGYSKLTNFSSMSQKFADPYHIGMPLSLGLVIFAEFFCAIFIVAGFATRLACIPLIISCSTALFFAHNAELFGEGEHIALFLGGFAALLFIGPGKASIDRMIGK